MSTDKLELKIVKDSKGNDIQLTDMSIETSRSLIVLIEALAKIVETTPDSEGMTIQVTNGSACVAVSGNNKQINTFQEDFDQIVQNKSTNKQLVESWRDIQNLFIANGLQYEANFTTGNKKTNVYTQIKTAKSFRTKSIRDNNAKFKLVFLRGKLIEIGGKNPNIHIQDLNDDKSITIACEEQEARKVNSFLYNEIFVSAWEKTSYNKNPEYRFCDVYVNENLFNEFQNFISNDLGEPDRLIKLHDKMRSFIKKEDFGNLKKFLRLFNHTSMDNNILKSILVFTKSFREDSKLKDIRSNLLETFQHQKY